MEREVRVCWVTNPAYFSDHGHIPDRGNLGVTSGLTQTYVILFIFTYFLLREPRDRNLKEVREMFQIKISTHKFKSYFCTSTRTEAKPGGAKDVEAEDMVSMGAMTLKRAQ